MFFFFIFDVGLLKVWGLVGDIINFIVDVIVNSFNKCFDFWKGKCFLYYLIWFIDLDRFVLIVNRVKDVWVIVYVYISVLV